MARHGAMGAFGALCGLALLCALGLGQRPTGGPGCGPGRLLLGTGTDARCCRVHTTRCCRDYPGEECCSEWDCMCVQPEFHCGDPCCTTCRHHPCPPGQGVQSQAPRPQMDPCTGLTPSSSIPATPPASLPPPTPHTREIQFWLPVYRLCLGDLLRGPRRPLQTLDRLRPVRVSHCVPWEQDPQCCVRPRVPAGRAAWVADRSPPGRGRLRPPPDLGPAWTAHLAAEESVHVAPRDPAAAGGAAVDRRRQQLPVPRGRAGRAIGRGEGAAGRPVGVSLAVLRGADRSQPLPRSSPGRRGSAFCSGPGPAPLAAEVGAGRWQ
ncbi:tumor necrosis factor receptor superfamily member 18 isoform X2 [Pan troglodytes]|uniref:tumor necrosis factor receptor superfamily member 18 isoform X2 n=1 Tax=Pan troglodytes TaxID=9598 RepID=UPI003013CD41